MIVRAEDTETEARALGATCGGVRVWSVYVPNGRVVDSEFYLEKLEWLARLRKHVELSFDPRVTSAHQLIAHVASQYDVEDVHIEGSSVRVELVLTTGWCPFVVSMSTAIPRLIKPDSIT